MPETPADIRETLAPRAFLYDDPLSYLAGVEDALRGAAEVGWPADATTATAEGAS